MLELYFILNFSCFLLLLPTFFLLVRLFSEAKAVILGLSDLYIKMGSKVILTCVISQGPHDLGTILWYRGNNLAYVNVMK